MSRTDPKILLPVAPASILHVVKVYRLDHLAITLKVVEFNKQNKLNEEIIN
jgi:hypothetical protein